MKTPLVTSGRLGAVAMLLIAAWALFVVPSGGDMTLILSGSIYCAFGILALSLALIWGSPVFSALARPRSSGLAVMPMPCWR